MGSHLGFLAVEGLRSPKMRIVFFLFKEWAGRLWGHKFVKKFGDQAQSIYVCGTDEFSDEDDPEKYGHENGRRRALRA